MLGGRLHAQHPDDAAKRYYTYRNRGYLVSQPGMRRVGLLELPRFAWYFLVTRRDPRGFREWVRLLPPGPGGAVRPRVARARRVSCRKTTVRSITKLTAVAVPWAITQATVYPQRHRRQHRESQRVHADVERERGGVQQHETGEPAAAAGRRR